MIEVYEKPLAIFPKEIITACFRLKEQDYKKRMKYTGISIDGDNTIECIGVCTYEN